MSNHGKERGSFCPFALLLAFPFCVRNRVGVFLPVVTEALGSRGNPRESFAYLATENVKSITVQMLKAGTYPNSYILTHRESSNFHSSRCDQHRFHRGAETCMCLCLYLYIRVPEFVCVCTGMCPNIRVSVCVSVCVGGRICLYAHVCAFLAISVSVVSG